MMRKLNAIVLLFLLAACGGNDNPPPPQPQPTSDWTIGPIVNGVNYSPGVVWNGNGFAFPTAAPGVHGLTRGAVESGRSRISMSFRIDGNAAFIEVDAGGGTPGPGKIRLFMQRCGDDWLGPKTGKSSYRFYSQPLDLAIGEASMQVALSSELWTNVDGQQDANGFAETLAALCTVGMGFGGVFAMHGAYATGPAQFILISYTLE